MPQGMPVLPNTNQGCQPEATHVRSSQISWLPTTAEGYFRRFGRLAAQLRPCDVHGALPASALFCRIFSAVFRRATNESGSSCSDESPGISRAGPAVRARCPAEATAFVPPAGPEAV